MTEAEFKAQMDGIFTLQEKLTKALKKAEKDQADARVALEKAQLAFQRREEELTRTMNTKVYEISNSAEYLERVPVDPQTGAPNAEIGSVFIKHRLSEDASWTELLGEFYKLQEALADAKGDLYRAEGKARLVLNEIGLVKNRAVLLAAYIRMVSPDG
jgi:hypothetical protein